MRGMLRLSSLHSKSYFDLFANRLNRAQSNSIGERFPLREFPFDTFYNASLAFQFYTFNFLQLCPTQPNPLSSLRPMAYLMDCETIAIVLTVCIPFRLLFECQAEDKVRRPRRPPKGLMCSAEESVCCPLFAFHRLNMGQVNIWSVQCGFVVVYVAFIQTGP